MSFLLRTSATLSANDQTQLSEWIIIIFNDDGVKDKSCKTSQIQALQGADKMFQTSDYYIPPAQSIRFGEEPSI
jgi:hypothetical protein